MRTQHQPSGIRPLLAVIGFFAVAGLLMLAVAPARGSMATTLSGDGATNLMPHQHLVAVAAVATPAPTRAPHTASPSATAAPSATATSGATATATADPQATATSTPSPQPTQTDTPPQPTPTATPAPSWHTIGSYSGTGPSVLVTITNASNAVTTGPNGRSGNVRVDWTCQAPSGIAWQIGFEVNSTGNANAGDGVAVWCGGSQGALSGMFMLATYSQTCGCGSDSWLLSMFDNADAGGPWTATVSVFS